MTRQLSLAERVAAARTAGEHGRRRSTSTLSAEHLAAFDGLIGVALATGRPFSLDTLRPHLDAAGIPNAARGGLIRRAIKAGLIVAVGHTPSTHRPTHGKPIAVYAAPGTEIS